MGNLSFVANYMEWPCIECGTPVNGEGVFATGEPLPWGYQPAEGECLKNIWMECPNCGWDQYS